ncbi:SpoIIE family protein phosphatase [Actinomadura sp. SCN-SB]|uniref:SpoIIE family protein phosphatase n=1 Tax=Actinomadura sp. SCN-SB TaxID=3373092 RepID=UPI0037539044
MEPSEGGEAKADDPERAATTRQYDHVPPAPAAAVVVDAEGTVAGWTNTVEDLLGYHGTDLRGEDGGPVFTPDVLVPTPQERDGGTAYWAGLVEARHREGHRVLLHSDRAPLVMPGAPGRRWLVTMRPVVRDPGKGLADEPTTASRLAPTPPNALSLQTPVAEAIWDCELRCVWLNRAAESLEPVLPHLRVGRSLTEPLLGPESQALEQAVRRVLTDGAPQIERELRLTPPGGGEERVFSIFIYRLNGPDGRPLGASTVTVDISHARTRDRLSLLGEASVRIGSTLEVTKTAQEMAELAVPYFADFVAVDLAETVLAGPRLLDRLASTQAGAPVFHRAGLASADERAPRTQWRRGEPVHMAPSSPFTEVLSTGRPHFEPVIDTSQDGWLAADPDRAKVIRESGMHSLIIVPLQARGDILGIAQFIRTTNPAPFTKDDLRFAEELSARAALSLDSARQYTRERTAALLLQRDLLPRRLTGGGAVEVASRYLPSGYRDTIGGDWYDTIPLGPGRIALVVGDVTGHGISAAAMMGRMRTAVRTLAYMGLPPDRLLAGLDDLISRGEVGDSGEAGNGDRGIFDSIGATCLYLVYDADTRLCTMATAGHPPPAIVDPGGEVGFLRPPPGTPIGVGMGSFESVQLELAEGSLIVLYTDGLVETRHADIEAGIDRLGAALANAEPPLEGVCDRVIETMIPDKAEDDVALLVARTLPSPPDRPRSRPEDRRLAERPSDRPAERPTAGPAEGPADSTVEPAAGPPPGADPDPRQGRDGRR